jgi:hypothetical protein
VALRFAVDAAQAVSVALREGAPMVIGGIQRTTVQAEHMPYVIGGYAFVDYHPE